MAQGKARLVKSVKQLDIVKQDEPSVLSGVLGITTGGKQVVSIVNRPGFVYVRLRDNLSEVIQAYNDKVAPVYDLPVNLTKDSIDKTRWIIVGRDTARYSDWGNSSPYLPEHGAAHSFNRDDSTTGGDTVWVYDQQIMPFLVTPSGSAGSENVVVQPDIYYVNDDWRYAGGTGTASLMSYKPTGGFARPVMVYLDEYGNPGLLGGSYMPTNVITLNGLVGYLPQVPDNSVPLGAIRLTTGSSQIGWGDIFDLRQFVWLPTDSGHVIQDEGVDLPQEARLNFIGPNVWAQDDAGNGRTNVIISGSATQFATLAEARAGIVSDKAIAPDTLPVWLISGSFVRADAQIDPHTSIRGEGSVDLQYLQSGDEYASGPYSVALGTQNTVRGEYSGAIGTGNSFASGTNNSWALGTINQFSAAALNSFAFGIENYVGHANNMLFSVDGDSFPFGFSSIRDDEIAFRADNFRFVTAPAPGFDYTDTIEFSNKQARFGGDVYISGSVYADNIGASNFLLLDASNGPITGPLVFNSTITTSGTSTVRVTNTNAFLVEDGSGVDAWRVDTQGVPLSYGHAAIFSTTAGVQAGFIDFGYPALFINHSAGGSTNAYVSNMGGGVYAMYVTTWLHSIGSYVTAKTRLGGGRYDSFNTPSAPEYPLDIWAKDYGAGSIIGRFARQETGAISVGQKAAIDFAIGNETLAYPFGMVQSEITDVAAGLPDDAELQLWTLVNGTMTKIVTIDDGGMTLNTGTLVGYARGAGTLTASAINDYSIPDHTHYVSGTSNPGAAAAILESDANGYLQLERLGLGIAPTYKLHLYQQGTGAANLFLIESDGNSTPLQYWDSYFGTGTSSNVAMRIYMRRAQGSKSVPSAVVSGDRLGGIFWSGHDGSDFTTNVNAAIFVTVDGAVASESVPTRMSFATTPLGATNNVTAMTIDSTGYGGFGTTSPLTLIHTVLEDTATTAVTTLFTIDHNTSNTAAVGFGSQFLGRLETNTTANQNAMALIWKWSTAVHANRTSYVSLANVNNGGALTDRIIADGNLITSVGSIHYDTVATISTNTTLVDSHYWVEVAQPVTITLTSLTVKREHKITALVSGVVIVVTGGYTLNGSTRWILPKGATATVQCNGSSRWQFV